MKESGYKELKSTNRNKEAIKIAKKKVTLSNGAVEYSDCFSADG